jgi:diaminopimelate decarboxylase
MSAFTCQDGVLHAESVSLIDIAERFGTPCWVYSRHALETAFDEFQQELIGLDSLVCYAVKANSNLAVLDVFARRGAGFDIVSAGELKRVLTAGADPRKIVFSGVGKTAAEMELALGTGILCFNVESAAELERLDAVAARAGKKAPISLRVNPDVDAKHSPLYLDRPQGKQVRRRLRRRASVVPACRHPGEPRNHRYRLPYRFTVAACSAL